MNILLLGSQHGNELLGERLFRYLQKNHQDLLGSVTFKVGNPKARRQKVRYIESDMNRSYDPMLTTYEAKRSQHIKKDILQNNYDIVLDLHTTTCFQPPCFIVAELNAATTSFLRASSFHRIVHLQHPMVQTSLIGHIKQAVSIEVSNTDITGELLEALAQTIRRYIAGEFPYKSKSLFLVDELILKSEVTPEVAAAFVNFMPSSAGFIPILTGENSYKKNTQYLGFKASKETNITL